MYDMKYNRKKYNSIKIAFKIAVYKHLKTNILPLTTNADILNLPN